MNVWMIMLDVITSVITWLDHTLADVKKDLNWLMIIILVQVSFVNVCLFMLLLN